MISEKDIQRYQLGNEIIALINKRFNKNYKGFIYINDTLHLKE